MPRFYFDFRDPDGGLAVDGEGLLLATLTEAKAEATTALIAHAKDVVIGPEPSELAVNIREGGVSVGEVVLAISFREGG